MLSAKESELACPCVVDDAADCKSTHRRARLSRNEVFNSASDCVSLSAIDKARPTRRLLSHQITCSTSAENKSTIALSLINTVSFTQFTAGRNRSERARASRQQPTAGIKSSLRARSSFVRFGTLVFNLSTPSAYLAVADTKNVH